jgi:hypothetical protein
VVGYVALCVVLVVDGLMGRDFARRPCRCNESVHWCKGMALRRATKRDAYDSCPTRFCSTGVRGGHVELASTDSSIPTGSDCMFDGQLYGCCVWLVWLQVTSASCQYGALSSGIADGRMCVQTATGVRIVLATASETDWRYAGLLGQTRVIGAVLA